MKITRKLKLVNIYTSGRCYVNSRYIPYICHEKIRRILKNSPKKIIVSASDVKTSDKQIKANIIRNGTYWASISTPSIKTSCLHEATHAALIKFLDAGISTIYLDIKEDRS